MDVNNSIKASTKKKPKKVINSPLYNKKTTSNRDTKPRVESKDDENSTQVPLDKLKTEVAAATKEIEA